MHGVLPPSRKLGLFLPAFLLSLRKQQCPQHVHSTKSAEESSAFDHQRLVVEGLSLNPKSRRRYKRHSIASLTSSTQTLTYFSSQALTSAFHIHCGLFLERFDRGRIHAWRVPQVQGGSTVTVAAERPTGASCMAYEEAMEGSLRTLDHDIPGCCRSVFDDLKEWIDTVLNRTRILQPAREEIVKRQGEEIEGERRKDGSRTIECYARPDETTQLSNYHGRTTIAKMSLRRLRLSRLTLEGIYNAAKHNKINLCSSNMCDALLLALHSTSGGPSTSADSRSTNFRRPSPEINAVVVSVASSSRSDAANRKSFTKRRNKRCKSSILTSDSPQFSRQNQKWIQRQTGKAPNFSHFPAGEDSNAECSVPRFYTSTSPSPTTSPSGSPILSTTMLDSGEPPPPSPQEYKSRHPPALPVVAQQAFTSMSDSLLPSTSTPAP
ncbi:hypothetical protein F5878DRAFT_676556, partial [Lentinula raphanica]